MAVPVRPVGGASIESAWGQVAHDTAVAQDFQAGSVAITATAAVAGTAVVTFPRPFAAAPIVIAVQASGSNASFAVVGGATATTATLQIQSRAGTAMSVTHGVYWFAIGPRA